MQGVDGLGPLRRLAQVMSGPKRISQMELQRQLDVFKAEFARTAPAGPPALYEAEIEELRASFALERAIRTGDAAPEFTLPDAQGKMPRSAVCCRGARGGDVLSWGLVFLL
jgi:hypothetical protein